MYLKNYIIKIYCHNRQTVKQEDDKRELYMDGCTYGCKLHLELLQSLIKNKKINGILYEVPQPGL
jgi:hypothetical protein